MPRAPRAVSASACPGEAPAASTGRGRRRTHVPSAAYLEAIQKLQDARDAARDVLNEVRKKKKLESKKHKRLMGKATKLSIGDLIAIAEMKGAPVPAAVAGVVAAVPVPVAVPMEITDALATMEAARRLIADDPPAVEVPESVAEASDEEIVEPSGVASTS